MHHTFLTRAKADELAARLNAEDDEGWTYKAKHCPIGTGWSYVEAYDEDGFLVGPL